MNLNVFKFMIDIIDSCAERGAFRGDELQNVGNVRAVIAAFIAENEPKPSEEGEFAETESPTN